MCLWGPWSFKGHLLIIKECNHNKRCMKVISTLLSSGSKSIVCLWTRCRSGYGLWSFHDLYRTSWILLGSNFSYLGSGFKETMGIFRKESIGMAIPITNNYGREQLSLLLVRRWGQSVKLAGKKPEEKWWIGPAWKNFKFGPIKAFPSLHWFQGFILTYGRQLCISIELSQMITWSNI